MLTSQEPLARVRVVEVATHLFAPMAGAILAEWGADVLKVEPPGTGDPYRGLVTTGLHPLHAGVDPYVQSANRGSARWASTSSTRRAGTCWAGWWARPTCS
jgi:crotonobetainyl-CoA:carnitine CoA-transferase CaiB-like acyl-CoA transferase